MEPWNEHNYFLQVPGFNPHNILDPKDFINVDVGDENNDEEAVDIEDEIAEEDNEENPDIVVQQAVSYTRLPGVRLNSQVYMDNLRYTYYKHKTQKNKEYLVCANQRNKTALNCPARAIVSTDVTNNAISISGRHNHLPPNVDIPKVHLRRAIGLAGTQNMSDSIRHIYNNEIVGNPEGAHNYTLLQAQHSVRAMRRNRRPANPSNIDEFVEMLGEPRHSLYSSTLQRPPSRYYNMSIMDQLFPVNHKTAIVVDHTPYFGLASTSDIKMDFTKRPASAPVPSPIFKSMWTCSIEAVLEYCRIVWDLFPKSKFVRVITSDLQSRYMNTWLPSHQNINHLLQNLSALGPPAKLVQNPDRDYSVMYGFRVAAEMLAECTVAQKAQQSKKNNIKTQNKCRAIIITSVRDNPSIDNLMAMFHNELIQINKCVDKDKPNSMKVHYCHLIIINTYPDSITCEVTDRPSYTISPILDLEVHSIPASKIGTRVLNLLLKHYNLASTTVTSIPMKEEQNANSSANYDVEIYHTATAHATIINANLADAKAVVAKKEGSDYETIKLKWCTPRAKNNLPDIHSCTTIHRITPVDITSRPSACLITFLLNGRSVLLEMIKQGGGKSISHILKSYNGKIYIHSVSSGRTVLEDPPSINDGPGGKVTQYRVADFGIFMRSNLLQPAKKIPPVDKSYIDDVKEKLKKQTTYWPLTTSSTIIFNLKKYTEPMLSLMVKDTMSNKDLANCIICIFTLISAESQNEPIIMTSLSNPQKIIKIDDQYKLMWTELETFLKSNLYSENHCKVLQYLFECRGKLDEEKIIEKTLMRFKKSMADRPSVIRAIADSPMSPPLTQQTGIKHLTHKNVNVNQNSVMYLQIIQNQDNRRLNPSSRPQFAGRSRSIQLRNGNLFTKLYQHIDNETNTNSSAK